MRKIRPPKLTIGRKDKADFPEFNLTDIEIKIDTGAFTSSIHTQNIKETVIDGEKYIEFQVLDPTYEKFNPEIFKTKRYASRVMKSSFGRSEQRFVITTFIELFGKQFPIELSLSERGNMKTPILIGRKLLVGKFIVDPAKYDLSFKEKRKKALTN